MQPKSFNYFRIHSDGEKEVEVEISFVCPHCGNIVRRIERFGETINIEGNQNEKIETTD